MNKMETTVLLKFSFFLLFTGLIVVFNSVIPLSLDSFNNYGEKTLENLWSFDEVLTLEITLFIILIVLSQLPVVIITAFTTEKDVNIFPEFWKSLSLFIFLVAGLLTPTIDGYTQLSFAGSAVSLYLIIISVTEKKVNIKFPGTAFLGS
jgi:Sec-independent protein secretion pathway component TatC